MLSLAASAIMVGLVFLFAVFAPSFEGDELKAEAQAVNFISYRNAVNAYALEHKTEGVVPDADLNLPEEFSDMPWSNLVVWEEDELRCYVYGPGSAGLMNAVSELLPSAAVGWNDNGRLVRNGPSLALPDVIGNRNIVSVIVVDKVGGL